MPTSLFTTLKMTKFTDYVKQTDGQETVHHFNGSRNCHVTTSQRNRKCRTRTEDRKRENKQGPQEVDTRTRTGTGDVLRHELSRLSASAVTPRPAPPVSHLVHRAGKGQGQRTSSDGDMSHASIRS